MSNPFEYADAINTHKNIIRNADNVELAEKAYNPFMVNRALSYHIDCIFYVNDVNINSGSDNIMQFEYLLHSVRPKKRFAKWAKPEKNEDISAVQEYYKMSYRKAAEACKVLTAEQIKTIKERLYKGGKK